MGSDTLSRLRVVIVLGLMTSILSNSAEAACVAGVAPNDTLRIRTGPASDYPEAGQIPPNACGVQVSGNCRSGWCPVSYRGKKGWSSAMYLREEGSPGMKRPPASTPAAGKSAGLCVDGIATGAALQVRSGPGAQYVPLYGFKPGTCGIRITGACRDVFCPVQLREYRGWADRRNLR